MSADNHHAGFTDEETAVQAAINARGLMMALFAYAREHGDSPETVAHWLGNMFAPSWEEMRNVGAREVARLAALNTVSMGATLRGLSGDERRGVASVTDWPDQDMLDAFEDGQDVADALYQIFEPVAAYLGLRYSWSREDGAATLTFEAGTSEP